jgi:DNA-binding CsgD family transcriptional regulator
MLPVGGRQVIAQTADPVPFWYLCTMAGGAYNPVSGRLRLARATMRMKQAVLILVLVLIVASNLYDLFIDYRHSAPVWHLVEEGAVVVISILAIVWLLLSVRRQRLELDALRRELSAGAAPAADACPALPAARHQLGEAIREQFRQWQLTGSEQEVALLLLKGLSFREIAAVRQTLEKTVRQQASGIYKKSGVSGRHAFAAWFIEDLL